VAVWRRERKFCIATFHKLDNYEEVLPPLCITTAQKSRARCCLPSFSSSWVARTQPSSWAAAADMADDPRRREWRDEPPQYGTSRGRPRFLFLLFFSVFLLHGHGFSWGRSSHVWTISCAKSVGDVVVLLRDRFGEGFGQDGRC
jgi:hypothetical protein